MNPQPTITNTVSAANAREKTAGEQRPSSLYSTALWRLGLISGRTLPGGLLRTLARCAAGVYWRTVIARRQTVIGNLLPVFDGQRAPAEKCARRLFDNFAVKLADLWRYESGLSLDHLLKPAIGWEHYEAARAQGRGVLIVTPHLGNWEFGAPMLTRRGEHLLVVTLTEPSRGLTELRRGSRARWNIETLVLGDDPFASVELIRRLEAGATVAVLVDRPPGNSAVTVELFGRSFAASIATAELARATGCAILPVCLPRVNGGYAAQVWPAVPYDRAALRGREARRELVQQVMTIFQPVIRQYADQWYHFVEVWPYQSFKEQLP